MHYIPVLSMVEIDGTIRGLELYCPQSSCNSLIVSWKSNFEDVYPLFEILPSKICQVLILILLVSS